MSRALGLLALLPVLAACNGERPAEATSSPMITGASSLGSSSTSGDSGDDSTSTSESGEGSQSASTFPTPLPDMPSFDTEGLGPGCTKIDFLFVLENGPMSFVYPVEEFQKRSLEAIEGFTAEFAALADFDIHVLVTKGDPSWAGLASTCASQCQDNGTCATVPDFPCWVGEADVEPCDGALGAGVVFPVGAGATNDRCELTGGRRYLAGTDPDFAAGYECIARVGNSGDPDLLRPAQGMVAAVSPQLNGPGGCNAGFLRDDALLVVVLFHARPDVLSAGTPDGWAESLIAAKHGDKDAVVMLGVLSDAHHADGLCAGAGSVNLEKLVMKFPYRVLGSICAESFVPFFSDAVDMVVDACTEYHPPA